MKKGNWTVVFEDKMIVKNEDDFADQGRGYTFTGSDHNALWADKKFSNVWAIQWTNDDDKDQVEHRDTTPHAAYSEDTHGNFRTQFIDIWDAAHLKELQAVWDADNVEDETAEEKVARLGAKPTSYKSK